MNLFLTLTIPLTISEKDKIPTTFDYKECHGPTTALSIVKWSVAFTL